MIFWNLAFPSAIKEIETLLSHVQKKDRRKYKNHKGTDNFSEEMLSYLGKESNCNAILGPFNANPFQQV